jgi:hypothetical protein
MTTPHTGGDPVLEALDALVEALADRACVEHAAERAELIRRRRLDGLGYRELTAEEERPLLVELVGSHLERLAEASARFRRAEAAALHAEGATMEQIADAFGVTRQRVSTVLREARARGLA